MNQTKIAAIQAETAKNKLRLDLFEKRIAIYKSASDFIAVAVTSGDVTHSDEMDFWLGIAPAKWMFGPEIDHYLTKELWPIAVDLHRANMELKQDLSHTSRASIAEERANYFKKMAAQRSKLDELCKPYFHFPS